VAGGTAAHILPGSSRKVLGNGRRVSSFYLPPEEGNKSRKGRETSGKLKRPFLPISFRGNFMSPFYRSEVSFHWPQYLKTRVALSKFGHVTYWNTLSFHFFTFSFMNSLALKSTFNVFNGYYESFC
jgi:hypothetical protein